MNQKQVTQTTPCVNSSPSALPSSQPWLSFSPVKMIRQQIAHAYQAHSVTLRASLAELSNNHRMLAALFLMLAIAPFSGAAYKLFSPHAASSWLNPYYGNLHYLLLGLHGNLMAFFSLLGIFFLFPTRFKTSYLCAAPMGYILANSITKAMATTNAQYNSGTGIALTVMACGLVVGFLLSINYLLYRHHHIKRKYWAHIVGIIKTPGIPAENKIALLEGEIKSIETNYYSVW